MAEFPNFEGAVTGLLAVIGQLTVLSILVVGFNNKIKSLVSESLKKYFFVFSILVGITLMITISTIRPDIFTIGIDESLFFGFFVGLVGSGLYDAGLGDKNKDDTLSGKNEV